MFQESPAGNFSISNPQKTHPSPYHDVAEAIRTGCKMAPHQIRGEYLSAGEDAACALGAAALGSGWNNEAESGAIADFLVARFSHLGPSDRGFWRDSILHKIAAHNDAGVTREEIADWLDSLR